MSPSLKQNWSCWAIVGEWSDYKDSCDRSRLRGTRTTNFQIGNVAPYHYHCVISVPMVSAKVEQTLVSIPNIQNHHKKAFSLHFFMSSL